MMPKEVILIASGDRRPAANQVCWPAQEKAEQAVIAAVQAQGFNVRRGHPYIAAQKHGFIDSQKYGMEVFRGIPADAPLIVVEAVWQFSHHVLAGLTTHKGPSIIIANWSGQWPGLVGMLNLNGCLTKAGVAYSSLWSIDFTDKFFLDGLRKWLTSGKITHSLTHAKPLHKLKIPAQAEKLGRRMAADLQRDKAIMGVFDEGCMGMYNAIIPDELLHPTGMFKERLSQSALYAAMRLVSDAEAAAVRWWCEAKGMSFITGKNEKRDLTGKQIIEQCKMYIAAVRMADDYGCSTIGIQYQLGMKDLTAASDLVEGLLNNTDRPPVRSADGTRELYAGQPLPHFNEVDECAGLDGYVTYKVWSKLGYPPENTLHDVRWGEEFNGEYVWVFLISGAAPPAHFIGGYAGATSERQPTMYFAKGGGTVKGCSKPGEIVWSRVYVDKGKLKVDIGRGKVAALPAEETDRRWQLTTPQWPIMHAVLYGVSRDQLMAKHKANHIQVAYGPTAAAANKALAVKAAMFDALGLAVNICGDKHGLGE